MMRGTMKLFITLFLSFLCFFNAHTVVAQSYYTWKGFEPDKLASIWLLQHLLPDANFHIVEKGEKVEGAIPFDIPTAKLRRYHSESTYESILRVFNVTDPGLKCIGKRIHEIEISNWNMNSVSDSWRVQHDIMQLIDATSGEDELLRQAYVYFETLQSQCR